MNVRSWQRSGASAQQSVGDHVKTAASSRRSNPSQQKQRQQEGTEDHEKPLERSFGMSKTIVCTLLQITTRSSDVSVARDCCSSRAPSTKKPVESATLLFRTS